MRIRLIDERYNKEFIPCECGQCNQKISKYDTRGRLRKFADHHVPKGRKATEETKKKQSLAKLGKYQGDKHWNWKGGKYKTEKGYIMVYAPEHPYPSYGKYVFEHRLVMEKHLGRYLTKDEDVHHIDGDRTNNDISNLELFDHGKHTTFTNTKKPYDLIVTKSTYVWKCTNSNICDR